MTGLTPQMLLRLRWATLPPQTRIMLFRLLADKRGVDPDEAARLVEAALSGPDSPVWEDVNAAIVETFERMRQTLVDTLAPVLGRWAEAVTRCGEQLREAGVLAPNLAGVRLAVAGVPCRCLCGQHSEAVGVCRGYVPAFESVRFQLPNTGAEIRVCRPCAQARILELGGCAV